MQVDVNAEIKAYLGNLNTSGQMDAPNFSISQVDEKIRAKATETFQKNSPSCFASVKASLPGNCAALLTGAGIWLMAATNALLAGVACIAAAIGLLFFRPHDPNRPDQLALSAIREMHGPQEEFYSHDEDVILDIISKGADIYHRPEAPWGWSDSDRYPSLIAAAANGGFCKIITYIAMINKNTQTVSQQCTDALYYAKDLKTAKLLVNLGGCVTKYDRPTPLGWFVTMREQKDVLIFFAQQGLSLSLWEDKKYGTSFLPTITCKFTNAQDLKEILTAFRIPSEIIDNPQSAENLYKELNTMGISAITQHDCQELYRLLTS